MACVHQQWFGADDICGPLGQTKCKTSFCNVPTIAKLEMLVGDVSSIFFSFVVSRRVERLAAFYKITLDPFAVSGLSNA